ncbi:MAG: leucine-rich repeat domain-containing protein, partial [Acholeplasmatales bacterium]|nr:leucine-rich repeat domain-containing protein [Acholeplasmatales bacterium]
FAFYNRILNQIAFEENSNLETIGGSAFTYDSSYTNDKIYDSITIPNSVIVIRTSAFYNIKFNNLYFEENSNLETIDSYAFSSYELEETNINAIPNSVRTIGYSSFHNRILSQIVFEENSNLETISDSAFSCKSSYESDLVCDTITIPSSVKLIGNYAFYNVHFNNLHFEENSNLERIKQSSFSSDEPFKTNINAIPNSILEIENSAFYNRILNQIVFEDDSILEAIDPSAFSYESEDISDVICETITIPSSVKLIGSYAFMNVRFNNLYFEENSNLETIDSSAFSANKLLYSNINAIPNSVKIIGDYAFYNRILNQIAFEENSTLETIGSSAFAYDSIYTNDLVYNSITIPNSVIKIDNEAFYNVHFNNLYFEENSTLETIGGSAFGLNNKDNILISEITLPASLKNINESAFSNRTFDKFKFEDEINLELSSSAFNQCYVNEFYYNSGIKNDEYNNGFYALYADKFIIPNTITEIDNDMFQYANIKTVVFEENSTLQKIGDGAFYSCHIESIILPNSLKEIGVAAFKTCNLKTIELPENVEIIGENAFYDNSSLEILIIGESLYEIGDNAFSAVLKYVFNKSTLRLAEGEDNYGLIPLGPESYLFEGEEANKAEIIDNFVMYHESETETKLLKYIGDNKNITIPSYVTYIDDYAFYANRIIEEVIIPDNVRFIGNNVFTSCYKLQNVVIGNGVERIKSSAFQYCYDLRTVVIGDSVTTIEQYAFYDCNHLTTITLGVNVETIETSAFGECFSLVEIHNKSSIELQIGDTEYGQIARYAKRIVTTDNFESYVEFNDDFAIFNYDGETYLLYYYGEETTQLIIPDYFTIIGNYAFIYTHIESIVLGENIKELEKGAFFYSNNYLQEVIFNDKLEIIGDDAFSQCYMLTNIVLPDSVTYIGDSAFFNIKHLKITVGSGLKTIGDGAFKNSLVEFKLSGENNIETIGDEAFMNCEFTTFELGENLLSIGNDAFNGTHIYEIKNDSILNITIESEDYGKIALNCINIYSSNDGESIIITDENGFSYITISSDEIMLIAYTGPTGSDVDLIIPEYITIIGGNVFKNVHFNNVIISKNITRICGNAFANSVCNTFTFEEGSNLKYIDDSAIGIDFTQTEFRLPDGLLEIGAYNFRYINVYTVYIPASVTKIGEGAFWNSTELKLIVFDKDCTLTELPNSAFGCLGYYDDLYVVLPTSLTLIDSDALYDYNATSYYLYYGTESDWQNVTVQNGYTYEVYYYSETEPTTEGNYWHFDENGNPVVWNSETE